ncbi:hypothetical protein Cgig2_002744 [Carnegiea gigantea]|uniref:Uncharacterized protein n=1 Tax=Carnegiea gigantea TaxID=171969 RepID=A0A9Q1GNA1_9CARY|nr:hypothetical protein Cgig2_002744 [Carnegiea gigantea]
MYTQKDCFYIPPCYLPLRWRSDMQKVVELVTKGVLEPVPILIDEDLRDGGQVLCPSKQKMKGRPRKVHLKDGKESAKKQTSSCSICKQLGCIKPRCPLKENLYQGVLNAFEKRQKVLASDIGLNPIFCSSDFIIKINKQTLTILLSTLIKLEFMVLSACKPKL